MRSFVARLSAGIAVVVVVCVSGTQLCRAGDNALLKGAWALQFEVDRDFDLAPFQGSTLSVKKQTADGAALRLGIDLVYGKDDVESVAESQTRDNLGDRVSDQIDLKETDKNNQSIAITVQKVFYPRRDKMVIAFFGFGPTGRFDRTETTIRSTREASATFDTGHGDTTVISRTESISSSTSKTWAAGLRGIIGVEWFAGRNISLLAEYGTGLLYAWADSEQHAESTRFYGERTGSRGTSDSKGISLQPGAVKFGLSAYF